MDVKKIVKILAIGLSGALMTTWAYLMGTADNACEAPVPEEELKTTDEEEEELSTDTQ